MRDRDRCAGWEVMAGDVLVSVDAPHFNAGLVLRGGVVIRAAPILARACMGRTAAGCSTYFRWKGWRATQRLLDV